MYVNYVVSEIMRIVNSGGCGGGNVGCGWGSHCHCHHCSSLCNTSILQNSKLAVFIFLNMRFSLLLQGRNVQWKLYKCIFGFY